MLRSPSPRPALRVVENAAVQESSLVVEGSMEKSEVIVSAVSSARETAAPDPARGRASGLLSHQSSGWRSDDERGRDAGVEALTDAQLVALSRAGDREAFEGLYRRHAAFALNLAVRIQGGVGDVEDIVHDAFLKAHDRLEELREDAAFRGWLASIVVRLVRSRLRRGRLLGSLGLGQQEPIDLDALAAEGAGPETRVLLAQIYSVLRRIPVDQRIAWILRYVDKHTLVDVAKMVGCSLATVKRRISAAQAVLDTALADGGAHG